MSFDIFPFIVGKIVVSIILLIIFLWPFIFLFAATMLMLNGAVLDGITPRDRLGVLGFIYLVFILFYGAYLTTVWPNTPSKCGCTPSDGYQYLMQNFSEYQKKRVAEARPVRTDGAIEIQRYMLVDWNPPKHFYVTLKNMQTGYVAENVYVSKHCNDASSLQRNVEYNLQVQTYTLSNQPGLVFYEFKDLYAAFC